MSRYGFYGRLASDFPSQVIVDATELCNLECIHCPHPEFKKSAHYKAKKLDLDLNQKMVDEVFKYGKGKTQYIRYTSNGEPLLNPKIYEMLEYAIQHSGTRVCLTTNGTILDEKRAAKLLSIGLHLIDISIDAFKNETYSTIRVRGNLDITRANVLKLLKMKKELKSSTRIIVSFVEQPNNSGEAESFEKFWKEQSVDYVVIRRLHSAAGQVENIKSSLQNAEDDINRKPCLYPWERITLNPAGYLAFCPTDWVHGSVICDYRTTTIQETWQSEFYQKLRSAHTCNKYGDHKFCGQCPDWKLTKWPDEGRSYADMVTEFVATT